MKLLLQIEEAGMLLLSVYLYQFLGYPGLAFCGSFPGSRYRDGRLPGKYPGWGFYL